MDKIQLYKEFYFKELSRKIELDNAVNMPVLTITTIITLNTYFIKETTDSVNKFIIFLSVGVFISITISLFKLAKSFFNLGQTNVYCELNNMETYYKYQKELKEVNKESEFDIYIEERFALCAGHNFEVNKSRTVDLAKGKRWLFYTIALTFLSSLVYIYSVVDKQNTKEEINKQINIMPKENQTPSNEINTPAKPDIVIGPTDVYIQNSQDSVPIQTSIHPDLKIK